MRRIGSDQPPPDSARPIHPNPPRLAEPDVVLLVGVAFELELEENNDALWPPDPWPPEDRQSCGGSRGTVFGSD
jgi:hypothetical protein